MTARKVNPEVQKMYDSFTPEERAAFDERLVKAERRLSDMRIAKSTGKLDERLLVPRVPKQVKNYDWYRKLKAGEDDELGGDQLLAEKDKPSRPSFVTGGKLPEGMDLAGYIRQQCGDGKALADFYINVLKASGKEARRQGIFPNHKLMAAAWLGERGWGKAKGEESDKGITINLIDHSSVNVAERPPIQASAIEHKEDDASEVGRDVDVTVAEITTAEDAEIKLLTDTPEDIDIENFSLRE